MTRPPHVDRVAEQFADADHLAAVVPLGNGHINDTFLATFHTGGTPRRIVIQRINKQVFPRPECLMENLRKLTAYAQLRLAAEAERANRAWQMPTVIPARDGRDYVLDDDGQYWRALTLIESAVAPEQVRGRDHAREVGSVLGHFHRLLSGMDRAGWHEALPGFHVTPRYLEKYDVTRMTPLAADLLETSEEARRLARFVEERRGLAATLQQALDEGLLVPRMIHGDPKVNNVMIDEHTGQGLGLIDLDTAGPGPIHYDFGDALRSLCNRAGEEEERLDRVTFDLDLCAAFVEGYLPYAGAFLTDADRRFLYPSVRLLAFELGLRFFEDHLRGNVYFKTERPGQNLIRARVQFRLCEDIERQRPDLERILSA